MSEEPKLVKHGLLTMDQFKRLYHLANDNEMDEYAALARGWSMGNVELFRVLFLGRDPLKHFIDLQSEEEKYRQKIILFSRDHGKSWKYAIDDPIHDICYSVIDGSGYENPRIGIIQETKDEAIKSVQAIQSALEGGGPGGLISKAFCEPLGVTSFKDKARKWTEDTILMHRKSVEKDYTLYGIGIGGAFLGAHPKKFIFDDIQSTENAKTPHLREQHWKWYTRTLKGMISPSTRLNIVGTPKYENDIISRLAESGKFKVLRMPGLNRMPTESDYELVHDENGIIIGVKLTEHGRDLEAKWPCPAGDCDWYLDPDGHMKQHGEHRSAEWLIYNIYLEDYAAFCSEVMLRIVAGDEARIRPKMLRFYSHDPEKIGKTPNEAMRTTGGFDFTDEPVVPFLDGEDVTYAVHGWDHAIGRKRTSDETAFTAGYRTRSGRCFFRTQADRWHYKVVWEKMATYYQTDPIRRPDRIVTEGINFQRMFGEEMQGDVRVEPDKVKILTATTDKDTALAESGLLNLMVSGLCYVDVDDYATINQLLTFTADQKGGHDDRVDSMRLCYSELRMPRTGKPSLGGLGKRRKRRSSYYG